MSFYDLQRFRREQDELERAVRDNKLLEERIENLKWQQRSEEYERERQDYRDRERQDIEAENERERRMNLMHETFSLQNRLEDCQLRHKFGIEEGKT